MDPPTKLAEGSSSGHPPWIQIVPAVLVASSPKLLEMEKREKCSKDDERVGAAANEERLEN